MVSQVTLTSGRFYSTYEELKRSTATSSVDTSICFYSTYEELKHLGYRKAKS